MKILRILGYILLHILTLGILLLCHYYKYHNVREQGLPVPPVPDVPEQTTLQVAVQPPKDPQIKAPPSPSLPPYPRLPSTPPLSQEDVFLDSLESLVAIQEQGFAPEYAYFILPGRQDLNPNFIVSYPQYIAQNSLINMDHQRIKANNPALNARERAFATQCLNQLEYLDHNYLIVNVSGDGDCLYRSYGVGYLCALQQARKTCPNIFYEETARLNKLPFATLFPELTQQVINLLTRCHALPSFQQIFDKIILSPHYSMILTSFLKELAAYTARSNIIQNMDMLSAKVMLISDLEEDLLPATTQYLLQQKPSLSQHLIFHPPMPLTSPQEQFYLLLEQLPMLFLTEQEMLELPPEEKQKQKDLEAALSRYFAKLDSLLAALGWEQEEFDTKVKSKLPPIVRHQHNRFLNNLSKRHPMGIPCSSVLSFFACLLNSPTLKTDSTCQTFYNSIDKILYKNISSQKSLENTLGLSPSSTEQMFKFLDSHWQCRITCEHVLVFLTMYNSLKCATHHSQLKRLQIRIAKLLKKDMHMTFEDEGILQHTSILKTIVEKFLQAIHGNPSWQQLYKQVVDSSVMQMLSSSDKTKSDTLYNQALLLIFLIFQHPQFLTNTKTREVAKELKLLVLPFLQYALKKVENQKILGGLTQSILGSIMLNPPEPSVLPWTSPDIVVFCEYFATYPEIVILHDSLLNQLLPLIYKAFPLSGDQSEQALQLIASLETTYKDPWTKFLARLNIVGYCGHHYPQPSPPFSESLINQLSPGFLLYSFLLNHPELRERPTELSTMLKAFYTAATIAYKKALTASAPSLRLYFNTIQLDFKNHKSLREIALRALVSQTKLQSESPTKAFKETLLSYLYSLNINQLYTILDDVKQQAESSHVSGLAQALRKPALCQILSDLTPTHIQELSERHGFCRAGFADEAEADVVLIRFPNHYGCLLRRTAAVSSLSGSSANEATTPETGRSSKRSLEGGPHS
ncbi:hypothetical protein Cs308_0103 [Candidatus Chlamydia sanziniae]|uniref:OTU domain-containing protein n=2 Tax=Candidatus Chlamydia sanziniae TaxID=1806891 RepID=A0A1A9HW56_9CHLA|nr:hypothetical protein Cs308_0103 [Candidatus Chlamydia sanziniae]